MQQWEYIVGYEEYYQVSDSGDVRNVKRLKSGRIKNKIIKHGLAKGYPTVMLSKEGKRKTYLLSRIVAKHFVPNPFNKPVVIHLDQNKLNSAANNLVWGTQRDNLIYDDNLISKHYSNWLKKNKQK